MPYRKLLVEQTNNEENFLPRSSKLNVNYSKSRRSNHFCRSVLIALLKGVVLMVSSFMLSHATLQLRVPDQMAAPPDSLSMPQHLTCSERPTSCNYNVQDILTIRLEQLCTNKNVGTVGTGSKGLFKTNYKVFWP